MRNGSKSITPQISLCPAEKAHKSTTNLNAGSAVPLWEGCINSPVSLLISWFTVTDKLWLHNNKILCTPRNSDGNETRHLHGDSPLLYTAC
ncbi:hypothetical protein CEXT_515331 [Caerostris extrusa]|uniref:Uncharacterized protein n=1 Tax=Caerostris extrusa TaxID=172846 RepID=A0AAV4NUC9_CAEEX|nr:hypothetical protein CEXT_515331 [Caerostris extrusa]